MNSQAIENNDPGSEAVGHRLQLVNAGSLQFGIFTEEISAIVPWQEPTPLPHAPGAVLGVVSIQGRMLTVLDLETLLSTSANVSPRTPGQLISLRGDEQLALGIEELGAVIQIAADDLPIKLEGESDALLGSIRWQGAEVKILNPKGLFPLALQGRQRRQRQF